MKVLIIITILFLTTYAAIWWSATASLRRHIGAGFLVSYLVPLYFALAVPRAPFFLAVVLILFLATTRDRLDAVCRFVLLALLLPSITWAIFAGPVFLVRVSTLDMLAFGVLIKCLVSADRNARPLRRSTVEDAFIVLCFLIVWLGGTRFPSTSQFLRSGVTFALLLPLPYLALRSGIRSSQEFMRVTACFAVASVLLAMLGFYETRHGWGLFAIFLPVNDYAVSYQGMSMRGGVVRAAVTMGGGALMLSIVLLAGLTATFYARRYVRHGWMLAGWAVAILLGLYAAQSRGNVALLPLPVLIFCVVRRKWGYAALVGVGTPALAGLLYALAFISARVGAFLNIGPYASLAGDDVYDYRQLLLRRGLEEAAKHRWMGTSLQEAVASLADITQGQHIVDMVNTYLTFYLISGLAGMVPLIVLLAMIWFKLGTRHVHRLGNPELIDARAFAISTLLLSTVQLSFMSLVDRFPLCLAISLAAARLASLDRGPVRSSPPKPVAAAPAARARVARPQPGRAALPTPGPA